MNQKLGKKAKRAFSGETNGVAAVREERRITLEALAEKSGIAPELLAEIEAFRAPLLHRQAIDLAMVLNCPTDQLWGKHHYNIQSRKFEELQNHIVWDLGKQGGWLGLRSSDAAPTVWYPISEHTCADFDIAIYDDSEWGMIGTLDNRMLAVNFERTKFDVIEGDLPPDAVGSLAYPIAVNDALPGYVRGIGLEEQEYSSRYRQAVVDVVEKLGGPRAAEKLVIDTRIHLKDGTIKSLELEHWCLFCIGEQARYEDMEDVITFRDEFEEEEFDIEAAEIAYIDGPLGDYLHQWLWAIADRG